MVWGIKINKVKNGYICEWEEESEDGKMIKHQQVFEERYTDTDPEESEKECTKEMLLFVKDYFAIFFSKHNKKNLIIELQ